jgi:hypothetical protein
MLAIKINRLCAQDLKNIELRAGGLGGVPLHMDRSNVGIEHSPQQDFLLSSVSVCIRHDSFCKQASLAMSAGVKCFLSVLAARS